MDLYKRILACVLLLVTLTLVGCNSISDMERNTTMDFPKTDKGYPQGNIVMINGKEYPLKNIEEATANSKISYEIELNLKDKAEGTIDVVLPQNSSINLWSIESNERIDLISYNKINCEIKNTDMIEGISSKLQKFQFVVPPEEDTSVSFKWSNVNEIEKSFNDKQESYLLIIKISQ